MKIWKEKHLCPSTLCIKNIDQAEKIVILCQSICLRRVQTKSRENSAVLHLQRDRESSLLLYCFYNVVRAVERPIASKGGTMISCNFKEVSCLDIF